MVRAAVAERQLVRLHPRREREQLVAEADAEHRHAAEQLAHDRDLVVQRLGIAGAVREQHAVVLRELVGVDVVRVDGDGGARSGEAREDRALDAVVDDRDADVAGLRVGVDVVGRDVGDERAARHRRLLAHRGERLVDRDVARSRGGAHRTALAQVEDEAARVDSRERDDAALVQPVRPRRPARLAHERRARVRPLRLGARGRDAVVADHRRGEADELLGVARVGDDLLVARHRRREDGLAERAARRRDRLAFEDRAVLEHEEAVHPAASAFVSHSPCSR